MEYSVFSILQNTGVLVVLSAVYFSYVLRIWVATANWREYADYPGLSTRQELGQGRAALNQVQLDKLDQYQV